MTVLKSAANRLGQAFALLFMAGFQVAVAQTPPGGGGGGGGGGLEPAGFEDGYRTAGDARYGAQLSGSNTDERPLRTVKLVNGQPVFDTNWNLSGNMVELTIGVFIEKMGVVPGGQAAGPPYLEDGWIQDITISVGGSVVYSNPGPIPTDVDWHAGLGTQWRVASTGWLDGTNIDIEVRATFHLQLRNAEGDTYWHVDDFGQVYPFKAYNRMQLLGTEINSGGVVTQDDRAATLGILNAGIGGLGTHTVSPANAVAALSMGKFPHLAGVTANTVFVDATHGTSDSYMDSFGWTTNVLLDPQAANKEINFATEVLPTSQAKTLQQPKYNLAVFYACEAMANLAPVMAYELSMARARACVGFEADVSIWAEDAITEAIVPVSKHAEVFFAALAEGMTVNDAVIAANTRYKVKFEGTGGASGYQSMLYAGAGSTRLKYVWVSNIEVVNLGGVYPNVNVIQLPILPPGGGPGGPGGGGI